MNRRPSAWVRTHAPAGTRWGSKALSLLLSLALCLSLLPAAALAAEPAAATADFTAEDTSPALALLGGTDKAAWDKDAKTLTLKGVDFTTTAEMAVELPAGATIVLAEGTTNTIASVGDKTGARIGIYADGALEIKGGGTLTVTAGQANGGNAAIVASGSVTISGSAKVTATCGEVTATDGQTNSSYGIFAGGDVTISDTAEVTATGGEAESSYGIFTEYNITISGGHVTAKTLAGESATTRMALNKEPVLSAYKNYYWRTSDTDFFTLSTVEPCEYNENDTYYVEFSNVGNITADFTAEDTSLALALLNAAKTGDADSTWENNTLTLKGVNFTTTASVAVNLPADAKIVLAEGTTNTITSVPEGVGTCHAICHNGDLEIQGSGTLTVTSGAAAQMSYGIEANGGVTISGSAKVIATGGTAEYWSYGISAYGNVTISDAAEVTATGGAGNNSYGISAHGNVTISDAAEVTATGGAGIGENADSFGIFARGDVTISGSNVIARTLAGTGDRKAALSKAPTLKGYDNNNYYWRTGDTDDFTLSTVKAYEHKASDTYVEFSNGGNIMADFTVTDTSAALALLGGEEKAEWNAETSTLTLKGVDFTTTASAAVMLPDGATIVLAEGTTNTIASVSEGAGSCFTIYANGALEIKGSGTLTVTAGQAEQGNAGICAGGVTISGSAKVIAISGTAKYWSCGIYAHGDVTISDAAEVTATGGAGSSSYGINARGTITISGGHVTAKTLAGESATTRMALNQAPVLNDYNNYYWRTSSNGSFITDQPYESSDTPYTYVEFCDGSTYVEYDVTVNGVKVTNLNKNDVLGDGLVRYDPDADTVYAGGSPDTLTITGTGSTDVVLNGYFPYLKITGAGNVTGTEVHITVQAEITCTGDVTINNEHSVVGVLIVNGAQDVTVTSSYSSYFYPPAICSGDITCYGDVTISNTGGGKAVEGNLKYKNARDDHSYTVKTGDSLDNLTDSVTMDAGETFTGDLDASAVKISVTHTAGEWQSDSTQHWQVCTLCEAEFNRADHTFSGSTCTVCGYTKPSGGGSGSGSSGGSTVTPDEPDITPTEPEITTDGGTTVAGIETEVTTSGTTSTATVSQDTLEKAVEAAESAAGQTNTNAAVEITVDTPSRATEVKVNLPTEALENLADSQVQSLTISSGVGTVTISPEAAASIAAQAQGDTVTVTISKVTQPREVLNDRQLAAVGSAPVYDLSVTSSGKQISQFGGGTITVSLPYTLKAGENPKGVVVYYVNDQGSIQRIRSTYDEKTQSVTFTTNHFSFYMVRYEATAAAAARFTDVPFDAYYQSAVGWAVIQGVTTGTTDTTFSPDASCTRAQMVTFLWRAAGSPKASGSNPFSDVSADAYYYDAVLWAVEKGITTGTSDTTFSPDATCTRAQSVTFLWRAAGSPAASGSSFSDVSSDAYYADAVAWAVQQNITTGTGNGKFSPNDDCTRAQIVTFLFRALGE